MADEAIDEDKIQYHKTYIYIIAEYVEEGRGRILRIDSNN